MLALRLLLLSSSVCNCVTEKLSDGCLRLGFLASQCEWQRWDIIVQLVCLRHLQRINAMFAQNTLIKLIFLRRALLIPFALDAISHGQLALLKAVLFDAERSSILDLAKQLLLPVLLFTIGKGDFLSLLHSRYIDF